MIKQKERKRSYATKYFLQHSIGWEATWRDMRWPPDWGMWTRKTKRTRVFFRPISVSPFLSSMSAFLSFKIPTQSILYHEREDIWHKISAQNDISVVFIKNLIFFTVHADCLFSHLTDEISAISNIQSVKSSFFFFQSSQSSDLRHFHGKRNFFDFVCYLLLWLIICHVHQTSFGCCCKHPEFARSFLEKLSGTQEVVRFMYQLSAAATFLEGKRWKPCGCDE